MKKQLTAKEAKELIIPIPKEDFIAHHYSYFKKCCVVGHLERLTSDDPDDYDTSNCRDIGNENNTGIRKLTMKYLKDKHDIYADLANVNNQDNINGYTEPEIKDRVIHLLDDMIAAGY